MDRRADDKDSSTNKKDADNSNKGKDADNSDKDKGKDKDKDKGKDDDADKEKTRARLIFELPQGAKLFVDDQPIANADTRRSFRTPALEQGEQYYYEFRVEYLREGKAQVEKKRVTVSAGDVIKADFTRSGGSTDIVTVEPRR